ncbi:MAG: baseplate J/gp47 family protein, partial [Candidatus Izemoplasmatales bacterium]
MAALIDVNTIVPPVSQIISDQLINYVNTVKDESITDVDVGSKMWTFMYSSGIQKVNLYYKLYQFKKQSFVLYATGKHLDLHGQERGVFRLQANYAEGLATFYRAQPSPIELKISQGVEVTTTSESADEDVITFITTEPGVIPANQLSVEVPIVCTIPGTSGNLPSSALNRMPTPPAGVHRVITTSTTGGTEQETDEDYRSRIIVALESLGKGTLSAITNAVRSVQGVRTVTIYDPTQILVGANYYLIDTNNIKCTKLETLNATIANNSVKLYIRNSETEANTKVLKIWSIDKYDVETLETFDNINDFEELVERINSTKKKYVLMNNGRPILELFTIQPEGSPLNEVYMEIVDPNITENYKYMNSPYVGLRYIFRVGNDIRNTEKYENIENIGQLVNTLNNSKIL